jgi:hypothetical protein
MKKSYVKPSLDKRTALPLIVAGGSGGNGG